MQPEEFIDITWTYDLLSTFGNLNELAISLKILSHPGHGISSAGQRKLDLLEILE